MRHFLAIAALSLACALLALGCHDLTPKQQRVLDIIECRVHSLVPFVPDALDLESIVRNIMVGNAGPEALLEGIGALKEDIAAARAAWDACVSEEPLKAPAEAPKGSVL